MVLVVASMRWPVFIFRSKDNKAELGLISASPRPVRNYLLAALPQPEYDLLAADLVECDLRTGEVLQALHCPTKYVWFPISGLVSLRAEVTPGTGLEIAMVGKDGVTGIVGIDEAAYSPLSAVVTIGGTALRIETDRFARAQNDSVVLKSLLCNAFEALLLQAGQSAVCSQSHLLEARLARALLMTRRCIGLDEFHMTHELLSQSLGVRRVGITKAATALQRRQLIRYRRGAISLIDIPGLAATACSCYHGDNH